MCREIREKLVCKDNKKKKESSIRNEVLGDKSSVFDRYYTAMSFSLLTNNQLAVLGELVLGDFEVERSGSLSYTSGDIVVRTVARAEPATIVTSLANRHTTEMGADTYEDAVLASR